MNISFSRWFVQLIMHYIPLVTQKDAGPTLGKMRYVLPKQVVKIYHREIGPKVAGSNRFVKVNDAAGINNKGETAVISRKPGKPNDRIIIGKSFVLLIIVVE